MINIRNTKTIHSIFFISVFEGNGPYKHFVIVHIFLEAYIVFSESLDI